MDNKITLFIGLLIIVLSVCSVYIVVRLRRISMQRSDAQRRAVEALEGVALLAKDLRSREVPAIDPTVSPGERLRQQYPGYSKRT